MIIGQQTIIQTTLLYVDILTVRVRNLEVATRLYHSQKHAPPIVQPATIVLEAHMGLCHALSALSAQPERLVATIMQQIVLPTLLQMPRARHARHVRRASRMMAQA